MIKLSKILSEGRSSAIHIDTALKIVQTHNPNGISNYSIYRGIKEQSEDFYYVQPSSHIRKSAHTYNGTNYYTILLDNLPSWKEYPKRSKSIICSTSNTLASAYGTVYCVIPKEGSKIAISPSPDIWNSFHIVNINYFNLNIFNRIIDEYMKRYELIMSKKMNKNNYDDIAEVLNYVMKEKDNFELYNVTNILPEVCMKYNYKNMFEFIDEILLNPEKNEFKIQYYNSDFSLNDYNAHELWTEDDCVLIHNNAEYMFYSKLRSNINRK